MTSIALIPARGGSRRIPRKNVRPFLGEPAIARTIRTVRESGVVDRVLVSTDDDEIADVARSAGAEVPGRRPSALADDHTTTIDVVRHAIDAWLGGGDPAVALWVVYPTALLLQPSDLRAAGDRFRAVGSTFLVPVLRYPHPVERRLRVDASGLVRADEPASIARRTQDLPPAFHDAGQFYIGRLQAWSKSSPLMDPDTLGFELPADRAVDIDEPAHWNRAERLAAAGGGSLSSDTPE